MIYCGREVTVFFKFWMKKLAAQRRKSPRRMDPLAKNMLQMPVTRPGWKN